MNWCQTIRTKQLLTLRNIKFVKDFLNRSTRRINKAEAVRLQKNQITDDIIETPTTAKRRSQKYAKILLQE